MEYISGRAELIPRMEPMWQKLNKHHQGLSPFYGDFYAGFTFEGRMADTEAMGDRVYIAVACDGGQDAGYVMAKVEDGQGEIASLYVEPEHRGGGVADRLMKMALEWLRERGAQKLSLTVSYGNERAFSFYMRHGFYPRVTRLDWWESPLKTETEG